MLEIEEEVRKFDNNRVPEEIARLVVIVVLETSALVLRPSIVFIAESLFWFDTESLFWVDAEFGVLVDVGELVDAGELVWTVGIMHCPELKVYPDIQVVHTEESVVEQIWQLDAEHAPWTVIVISLFIALDTPFIVALK